MMRATKSRDWVVLLAILSMVFAGLGVAYIVVNGNWMIATAMIFAIPAVIALHQFPFIALIIWMFLSPFLVQTPSAAERQIYWLIHRLMPLATLGFLFISTGLGISKRSLQRLSPAEYGMFGYIAVSVLSIILLNNTVSATLIRFYDSVFIPMCLYWIIKLTGPGEKKLKLLVPVALFIVVTQVIIGSLSWFMPSILPTEWLNYVGIRTTGSLNSVSVFTTTLTFSGLVLLYTAVKIQPGWKRTLLIIGYVMTLYAIFISFSRASWMAGILVTAGVIYLYPRFMVRLLLSLVPFILLIGGTFLATQLETANDRLTSDQAKHSALSRLPVVIAAYRMFEAKPIFGWGYDNFDRYDRRFQTRFGDLVNPDEKDLTSHNVYLTILAEQGVAGLGLFLFPLFWLLIRTFRVIPQLPRRGYRSREMLILLWLVILSFIVVNNFAPMVVVFGLGLTWISLGLIANIIQTQD